MTTKVSAENIIAKFEGKKLKAYLDSAGIWTIGYGIIRNIDTGEPIKQGDIIDDATALRWLKSAVNEKMSSIKKMIKVPVTNNMLVALTSLAYNIGSSAFSKSTLLRLLNAKAPKIEVADQFLRWNKVKGVTNKGLTNRRVQERALFLK